LTMLIETGEIAEERIEREWKGRAVSLQGKRKEKRQLLIEEKEKGGLGVLFSDPGCTR